MRLGLKIDVDTLQGLREGVPALARILKEWGIRASFFVALGPDCSGRAVLRVFRQRGFLKKMWRTKAPAVYGLKTMLYGTVLPAPVIGEQAGEILPRLAEAGHEVGLHGYNHVRWHDSLLKMSPEDVKNEVTCAQEAFISIFQRHGRPPPRAGQFWPRPDLSMPATPAGRSPTGPGSGAR